MERILMVEDSEESQFLVKRALGNSFEIAYATGIKEALNKLEEKQFDLILLDVSLSDGDGFQFCSDLRNREDCKETPIIFLTGKSTVPEKMTGFILGADDYVSKPFEPMELKVRVESKIRRFKKLAEKDALEKGGIRINSGLGRAFIVEDGKETELFLTPIEFKLLYFFMRNHELGLTRSQLLKAIWGESVHVADRTIDKHVSSLRSKLQSKARFVQTLPGTGYRFSAKDIPLKA